MIDPTECPTLRAAGWSLGLLAVRYGVSREAVRQWCQRHHVPAPAQLTETRAPGGGAPPRVPTSRLLRLAAAHLTMREIGAEVGLAAATVHTRLRRAGWRPAARPSLAERLARAGVERD